MKMVFKLVWLISIWFGVLDFAFAQTLHGKILDEEGAILPFASVYLEGTTKGTTSNADGEYVLKLEKGSYQVIFQYVGYEKAIKTIELDEQGLFLEVRLKALSRDLKEVVVKANQEDPAYAIIRQAIKKRKVYQKQVKQFSCESYMKGVQYVTNLPISIMGQSLEEFRKELDSTGTGIVYFSESVSKLYFDGEKNKEVMISSKVSGNDKGFSWNSGMALYGFSFYDNQIELLETPLLSPIAQNALSAYNYRLTAAIPDEKGRLIYRIEVIPKNSLAPLFRGEIYIVDEIWAIQTLDLYALGKAANIAILDTIRFQQIHLELGEGMRRLFSQQIQFNVNAMGVEVKGNFMGVFRNYDIQTPFEKRFFDAEIFRVEESANQREKQYWDSIRPIPLTSAEQVDYLKKDSLQQIWESPEYLDSLDKLHNRLKFSHFVLGYAFRKRSKGLEWSISSPLLSFQFNTIQGWNTHLGGQFVKTFDREQTKRLQIDLDVSAGLAEQKWRGKGEIRYKFNDLDDLELRLSGGNQLQQFQDRNSISPVLNTIYSQFFRRNFLKTYDRKYFELTYIQRVWNGLTLNAFLSYDWRFPLINHSDYSFYNKGDRTYFSNYPLDFSDPGNDNLESFEPYQSLSFNLYCRFRFGQKYVSYPNRRFHQGSSWPTIIVNYRRGIPVLGGSTNYDYLSLTIRKMDVSIGGLGLLSFNGGVGGFPTKNNLDFIDYRHFIGNQTIFAKMNAYLFAYQLLPYYAYSTDKWFGEVHVQHDFNGFIWNKLPFFKHLGFEFVLGYHLLYTPDQGLYNEFNVGLDRLGWNLFRFGRIDFVTSYASGEGFKFGAVLGLEFSL